MSLNSEAYKIVKQYVNDNRDKIMSGSEYGDEVYYSDDHLSSLIAVSTAHNYACQAMIELGIRNKRERLKDKKQSLSDEAGNNNTSTAANVRTSAGYTYEEFKEKLEGKEYLAQGLYMSIIRNNEVDRDWNPLELIVINKRLFDNPEAVLESLDIDKMLSISGSLKKKRRKN